MVNIVMQVVNQEIIAGKRVILRYDIDVQIQNGRVTEDFKLRAGLETLNLCLQYAEAVILIGHIGRPEGKKIPELSTESVRQWFAANGFSGDRFKVLENLRFDPREEACDEEFAKELAKMGDIYINEGFGSYRPAVSTTVLPKLLPHAAGLRFVKEINVLTKVRSNPQKPFTAIMGGAKVKEKVQVINVLAQKADAVLIGGRLVAEIQEQNISFPKNVIVGKLIDNGLDIADGTVSVWEGLIKRSAMIVWNGPLGKFEDAQNKSTEKIAKMILDSEAEIVIGGGDSVAALHQYGLLEEAEKKAFVSVGGGAMLKFLAQGTLPTIEALV